MRFQRLDLNLLVALDALLTEKSVSVAADRICLSQSATSSALGRLREYFGDDLLVMKGRKMVLTERGEELVEPVRNVLHMIRTTIADTPDFDPAQTDRKITIMASDYTTEVLLTQALQDMAVLAPDMSFVIHPMSENPPQALDRGGIDLLITIDMALSQDHPSMMLFEDDYVVLGWDENPMIADGIDADTYFEMGHITTGFAGSRIPAFEEWFMRNHAMSRRIEVTAPSFMSVPFLIIGTNRIGTVHKRLARRLAKQLPLKIMPTPFEIPPIRQAVQWHRANSADQCLGWVVQQLLQTAIKDGDMPPPSVEDDELRQSIKDSGFAFPITGYPSR